MKFLVPDMTCGHCASHISKAIQAFDPAAKVTVDIPAKSVSVETACGSDDLARVIAQAGYSPQLQV